MENPFRFKTHREKYTKAEDQLKKAEQAIENAQTSNTTPDMNRLAADEKKAQDKVAKLEGEAWDDAHKLEEEHQELQKNVRKAQEALHAFEQKKLGMNRAGVANTEDQQAA